MNNTYLRTLLLTTTAMIILLCLPAILIDPYRVFGLVDFNKKNFEPNTRYLKIEHLLKRNDYNAYIFGTSRVGFYDVRSANKFSGNHYYNMTASGQNDIGLRKELEWVLTNKNPRQIIIALDYDVFHHKAINTDLLRQEHPLVAGESWLKFYALNLLFQPKSLLTCIQLNFDRKNYYVFDPETGQAKVYVDNEIPSSSGPSRVIKQDKSPERLHLPVKMNLPLPNTSLHEIQRIAKLSSRPHLERIIIINPYYHRLFLRFNIDSYTTWLRKMVDMFGSIWDFSGINSVTTNDENYIDFSHFSKPVGDLVLQRIFASEKSFRSIPDDFGVKVTKDNVEEHIRHLRLEYERQLKVAYTP
ncbi:hypothetical protein [Anthocerotibacter panamensis]|uniref:hypothetical protein n=1 Tax=Anthocerotibacter panamensis TaxID=2857077 RepID=UPI001C407A7E|nr:hypothetical protein [Anthocerotibacter panamensis]